MKQKLYRFLGLGFLVLTLVALPGMAQSAMWVGGQVGGNFAASEDVEITNMNINAAAAGITTNWKSVKIEPSVIGGITLGYDFIKEGFAGYDWPAWMKYFSFAVDFTFNRFNARRQYIDYNTTIPTAGKNYINGGNDIEGYMAAWTFLFMAHYGILPDAEVPAGRLHPYVGVGPCLLFSGISTNNMGNDSSVDICLVAEAGLRFFALKNVSLDAAFRYRYASPSYEFHRPPTIVHDVSFDAHQFSFLFRANYHF